MTREVRLRPEAEQDLVEAATWYEVNQPGLGQQFLDEVQETLSSISEQPLAYTLVYRSVRRALLSRFPFGVFYVMSDPTLIVVAVLHGPPPALLERQAVAYEANAKPAFQAPGISPSKSAHNRLAPSPRLPSRTGVSNGCHSRGRGWPLRLLSGRHV